MVIIKPSLLYKFFINTHRNNLEYSQLKAISHIVQHKGLNSRYKIIILY